MSRKKSGAYEPIESPSTSPRDRQGSVGTTSSSVAQMSFMPSSTTDPQYNSSEYRRHRPMHQPIFMCTDKCLDGFRTVWDKWNEWAREHPLPEWISGRVLAVYLSGALFSMGWWFFIDGIAYHNYRKFENVPVEFVDWLPGLGVTIAFFMMNMVNKEVLNANDFTYSGYGVAWKARLWFFISVVLAFGSLGGAVGIFSVKYIGNGHTGDEAYCAIASIIQVCSVLLSGLILWAARNYEETIHL